jgi:hypothetical protein
MPELDFSLNPELNKYKLFMDTFKAISTNNGREDDADVQKDLLFHDLIDSGKFSTRDEVSKYLKIALSNGQIYERRKGWYAKT